MSLIYHIIPHTDWITAQKNGEYRAESLDTEGFIHCSTAEQAAPVANATPASSGAAASRKRAFPIRLATDSRSTSRNQRPQRRSEPE